MLNSSFQLKPPSMGDGVATLVIDVPGAAVNVLSTARIAEMEAALNEIEAADSIRAVVLVSGKDSGFVAGADLRELAAIMESGDRAGAELLSREAQRLFARIERSPKPFVAAVHGAALGGGLELALACRGIVASTDPSTVLGLPEVKLGLLPGAGGTQRLPRRVGLRQALPMILTGSQVRARKALKIGLVDATATRESLVERARGLAAGLAGAKRGVRSAPSMVDRLIARAPLRGLVLRAARKSVARQTRGNYPAPPAILASLEEGLRSGDAAGYAREAAEFGRLVASPEARCLTGLFHAINELKKQPPGPEPRPVRRLAMIGAGLMGEGIASVSLPLADVVLEDLSAERLAAARARIESSLAKRVAGGSLAEADAATHRSRLQTSTDPAAVAGADLVVEAVLEDLALKRKILAQIEPLIDPRAVFASNTSALPIAAIAEGARHPERVIGMHYFSPVPKMPLLEVVVTPRTSPEAIATARAFGAAQGKTVIVVRDGPGFYTTRILATLLNEAMLCLEEGVGIRELDSAMMDFGFPVGPVALLDEVGIDVGAHVSESLGRAFASRLGEASQVLTRMKAAGLLGRKSGRGFYLYDQKKKRPNDAAMACIAPRGRGSESRGRSSADSRAVARRVALAMVNEAAHCLDEGVIESARDGDVGAILGLGFPPFRGGPFAFARSAGHAAIARELEALAASHGPRFKPAAHFTRAGG